MSIIDKYVDFIREQKKNGGVGFIKEQKPDPDSEMLSPEQQKAFKNKLLQVAAAKHVVHGTDPGEHANHPNWKEFVKHYENNIRAAKDVAKM